MERLSVSRLPSFDTRLSVYTCVSLENFQGDALPPEIKFFDSIFSKKNFYIPGIIIIFHFKFFCESFGKLRVCRMSKRGIGRLDGWIARAITNRED